MPELTAERARELFEYEPLTGVLTRRTRKGTGKAGAVVGCKNSEGYMVTSVDGRLYYNHRLVWLIVYGRWPMNEIDHTNGDKVDNRLTNLRDATSTSNKENLRGARSNNRSGFLGVCWVAKNKKFQASIQVGGKAIHIGLYTTAEEAYQAYLETKRQLHAGNTL